MHAPTPSAANAASGLCATSVIPAASCPEDLRSLYGRAHGSSHAAGPVTVLHLGAERTWIAAGTDARQPALVLMLALGHDRTARDFFRSAVPTPLELETAIASVEDEVHAAHRLMKSVQGDGRQLAARPGGSAEEPAGEPVRDADAPAWSADAGLHALATLAGIAPGPVRQLPLDAMERLFNRLASVAQGRPAAHEGLPENGAFAARLLVLRELMHHMPFASITLVDGASHGVDL